jgi:isochorismate synthase
MLTEISNNHTQIEVIQLLLQLGFTSGGSFALWKKPQSSIVELVLDEAEGPVKVNLNLDELKAGFIVHPFIDQEDKKAFFIRANKHLSFHLNKPIEKNDLPEWAKVQLSNHKQLSPEQLQESLNTTAYSGSSKKENSEEKSHFLELVKKGIQAIEDKQLEKVVPARRKTIPILANFNLENSIISLMNAYPNTFVNFFHIPKIGTWMGATPELLMQTKGDIFTTMSLAGTQVASGDNPTKSAAWTQKEIEEQALVSRYIVSCFKIIRLREYEESGPKTVLAGNLLHLRSDFKIDMKATGFPQLGSVMLNLLHPTSAVSGMPRKESQDFLRQYEELDRAFYAGFIGPVNIQGETSIFVNLRTAQLFRDKALLYAGAGVTSDSIPEKEWEETELKCQIIGKFIQNPTN